MSERITRRKTGETVTDSNTGFECNVWNLERGDEVVGRAFAVHKTKTQRFFEVELSMDGYTASSVDPSIRGAVRLAEEQIEQAKAADAAAAAVSVQATDTVEAD